MKLWNYRGQQQSITQALQLSIPDRSVISVTGSGGKTSLIFAWASELALAGRRVAVTTTTHMMHPDLAAKEQPDPYEGVRIIYAGPSDEPETGLLSEIDTALNEDRIIMVVSRDPDRPARVMSPPGRVLDHLYGSADVVLIEADGSRRMPLKWPAPWEPAVPDNTDITVCVAGLSALGRDLSDVMYRAEDLPAAMQRPKADEALICAVLSSLDGGQKGAIGEFRVFLNQADNDDLLAAASRMQMRFAVCGIQSAWGTLK